MTERAKYTMWSCEECAATFPQPDLTLLGRVPACPECGDEKIRTYHETGCEDEDADHDRRNDEAKQGGENPYTPVTNDDKDVRLGEEPTSYLRRVIENARHFTWEEGRVNGDISGYARSKAERQEVVDALVEACKRAEFVLHNSSGAIGLDTAAELRGAIARAEG